MEYCHAAKSLYRVSRCIAAICLSMLGSNALIAFDINRRGKEVQISRIYVAKEWGAKEEEHVKEK